MLLLYVLNVYMTFSMSGSMDDVTACTLFRSHLHEIL